MKLTSFSQSKIIETLRRSALHNRYLMNETPKDLCNVRLYEASKKYSNTLICRMCQKLFSGKGKHKDIQKHIRKHFRKKVSHQVTSDCNQNLVTPNEQDNKSSNNKRTTSANLTTAKTISIYSSNYQEIDHKNPQEYPNDETNCNAKYELKCAGPSKLQERKGSTMSENNISDDTPDELVNYEIRKTSSAAQEATKQFLCDMCAISFKSTILLKQHVIHEHKETEFLFDRCRLCKDRVRDVKSLPVFSTLSGLTQHVVQHHQPNLGLYICTLCSMNFCNKIGIKLHAHYTHGEGQYGVRYSGMIM